MCKSLLFIYVTCQQEMAVAGLIRTTIGWTSVPSAYLVYLIYLTMLIASLIGIQTLQGKMKKETIRNFSSGEENYGTADSSETCLSAAFLIG